MKKALIAIGVMSGVLLTGCSSPGQTSIEYGCSVSSGGGFKCEVKGKWKSQSFMRYLKPAIELLADSDFFSYEDFLAFDPSTYMIQLSGNSGAAIKNNEVDVIIFDEYNSLLTSKTFRVTKVNNNYKLADPSSFSDWSSNHLDLAERVEVNFEPVNHDGNQVTTTVSSILDGQVKASATYTSPKRPGHELPKDPL